MPMKLRVKKRQRVQLEFALKRKARKPVSLDLSCVAQSGRNLWVASDETVGVERLSWDADHRRFQHHLSFDLTKFFRLPAGSKEEIDIEGLAIAPPYLWITGSHSLKRGKLEGRDFDAAIRELTGIERETNRYFLARVPLVASADAADDFELRASAVDPRSPRRALTPARLFGTGATSVLSDALRFDDLLGPYMSIPSKDNGLDVEGLAVTGDRVLLGLRGPVLRGWAVVLELEPEYFCDGYFTLGAIGKRGRLYRRHFFDLQGLGVRDLEFCGDDLLILAGPTMAIDGRVLLLRWKGFKKRQKETVVTRDDLQIVLDFGAGDVGLRGQNHPEGIAVFTPPPDCDLPAGVLVTYDAPAGNYRPARNRVAADLFPLG